MYLDVRSGYDLTTIKVVSGLNLLDPKDAEYNPAIKDMNCDFKSSNDAPWGLLHTHRNVFMPLFQCFDFKSLR